MASSNLTYHGSSKRVFLHENQNVLSELLTSPPHLSKSINIYRNVAAYKT